MEKSQKNDIIKKIEKEIEKTIDSIQKLKEMSKPVEPDDSIGRITRMDAINNKSVAEAVLLKNKEKLKQLNHMLQNIDEPDFGLCTKCRTSIPIGRILLMPQSNYCVNCAP